MTDGPAAKADLFEARIGVFATPDGVAKTVAALSALLRKEGSMSAPLPWDIKVVEEDDGTDPDDMPLTEFYDELPDQWHAEHPGEDPGERTVHEIRVGMFLPEAQGHEIRQRLNLVLCPELQHSGPCPIPWSSSYVDPITESERDYLERTYPRLRPAGRAGN
ncbi:hypothetical protein [Marinactinospora rubrisoli]|uniref:Uncharacterized protein n=1 Tax=Marinactinospora rubrisoli TaxID=2715399 RepID=A0ABW2KGA7_9ACTN